MSCPQSVLRHYEDLFECINAIMNICYRYITNSPTNLSSFENVPPLPPGTTDSDLVEYIYSNYYSDIYPYVNSQPTLFPDEAGSMETHVLKFVTFSVQIYIFHINDPLSVHMKLKQSVSLDLYNEIVYWLDQNFGGVYLYKFLNMRADVLFPPSHNINFSIITPTTVVLYCLRHFRTTIEDRKRILLNNYRTIVQKRPSAPPADDKNHKHFEKYVRICNSAIEHIKAELSTLIEKHSYVQTLMNDIKSYRRITVRDSLADFIRKYKDSMSMTDRDIAEIQRFYDKLNQSRASKLA